MKTPEISIILPTFNRGHCVKRAIQSVIRQTFKYWELIIVDDGSTDNTAAIIDPFIRTDIRIRFLSQPHKGDTFARNAGIKTAKGEIITFLDSDDIYKPDHLEKNLKFISANPGIGMVYGTAEIIGDRMVGDMENPGGQIDLDECAIFGTFFIRRRVLEKTGDIPPVSFGSDYLLLKKIVASGFTAKKLDLRTYVYDRSSSASISKDFAKANPPPLPARTG